MEDWIRDLVNSTTAPIRELVEQIRQRLTAIYNTFIGLFVKVGKRFDDWISRARRWKDAQLRHAASVLTTLRWVILTYVPRKIGDLARSITAWTREQIEAARTFLLSELTILRKLVTSTVNTVIDTLNKGLAWATGKIDSILSDLRRIKDVVFGVLSTPERLAKWVAAAMFGALFDLAIQQADRVAEYLWKRRLEIALRSAQFVETIVSRII